MSLETAQLRIAQIQSMIGMAQGQRLAAQTGGALAPGGTSTSSTSPFAAQLAQATAGAPTATTAAYSPLTQNGTGAGANIVSLAQGEIGQAEYPPGSNDSPRIAMYRQATAGAPGPGPWCAYFASWACNQAGVPLGDSGQGFGRVDDVAAWAQRTGRWMPNTATPQPGDLIVWDEHIGIVQGVLPDGSIQTIEGNSSDKVSQRVHPAGSMLGYVHPG